jgi:HK97 family phage portal protein
MLFASTRPPPQDDCWYSPLAGSTASGVRALPDRVKQLNPVSACLRAIAETLAVLPVHVYRERADGTKEIDTEHPINDLLRRSPNALQSSAEWLDFMTRTAALRGNAYSRKVVSGDLVLRLIPLPHDTVKPVVDGFSIYYEVRTPDGIQRLREQDVLHLRAGDMTDTGLIANDPIEAYAEVFSAAIAAQDYAARYFRNDATPRGVIEVSGSLGDENKVAAFARKLKMSLRNVKQHSNLVLTGGATYKQVGSTNRDSQLLELRKLYVVELCRIFGVPPHVAKDLGDATYSNIEQQSIEFVQQTIDRKSTRLNSSH